MSHAVLPSCSPLRGTQKVYQIIGNQSTRQATLTTTSARTDTLLRSVDRIGLSIRASWRLCYNRVTAAVRAASRGALARSTMSDRQEVQDRVRRELPHLSEDEM